jgi:hypothetical protein
MKKILLILMTILALDNVSAQYYSVSYVGAAKNPGGLNTDLDAPVGGGIATGWSTLIAGNKPTPVWSVRKALPFTFNFNGTDFDSIWVSTSGVVTFSSKVGAVPAYKNTILPDTLLPENSICVRGITSVGNNSGFANVVSKTFGTNGKRQFYITYSAYNALTLGANAFMWASIVLEEGSNNIYFVDSRKAPTTATKLTLGIQFTDSTALNVAGSPNINFTAGASATDLKDNSYYQFSPGVQPVSNTEGVKSFLPEFLAMAQTPVSISAQFRNVGSAAITKADVNYSINNGTPVTVTNATVNIGKSGGLGTVTSSTKWTPSVEGSYKVAMWLSNLNGNEDEEHFNDTVIRIVNIVQTPIARLPLHEVFTSSTCGPCVAGNMNTDDVIFPQYDPSKFTVIKYQQDFPGAGDPYATAETVARRNYYGVNAIPNMQVDGGWNGNAASYSTFLFDQFSAVPAFMKVEASHEIGYKKITVDVKLTSMANYNNPNLRVFVAVCEKVTSRNIGTNGEVKFHHVMKKMLPNENGTAVGALTKDNAKSYATFTYNIPGSYRLPVNGQSSSVINLATENSIEQFEDCEVIVFVQDVETREVYQSINSTGKVLSIDEVDGMNNAISVYPNPSSEGATFVKFNLKNAGNVNVKIYNTLGQVVETISNANLAAGNNTLQINTAEYANGIYTIQIDGENFSSSSKFIVQ